jgi:transposase-like protein
MTSMRYTCESCESQFTIQYDEMHCEDSPTFCSFCGEYLVDDAEVDEDE